MKPYTTNVVDNDNATQTTITSNSLSRTHRLSFLYHNARSTHPLAEDLLTLATITCNTLNDNRGFVHMIIRKVHDFMRKIINNVNSIHDVIS